MTLKTLEDTQTAVPNPPTAKKLPKVDVVHGDRRQDDYFWLREKSNPEVAAYLEAENAYTDAVMKPTEAFQGALYDEMLARIQETDVQVPYRHGAYFYYSRTEAGKQYPILCRKHGSLDAPEQVTLDLNELAEGHAFLALGVYVVSDDGHLLAYSTDTTGFRQYDLFIKDLRTGVTGPALAARTGSAAWAADNRTLFYTIEDEATKRQYRLYRHELGAATPDALVYEEADEAFNIGVGRTRSRAFLVLGAGSLTTSEASALAADDPRGAWRTIAPRVHDQDYDVDARSSLLLKETPVLGGYDRTQYVSERLFAVAPDGVQVPLSIVYRKGTPRDGSAPLLMGGYGAYGFPLPVTFSSGRLSLLDRGMVVALAHVRGGGEMGKPWHDDGRMLKKRNTFTDFIACAEQLVARGDTSSDRLVIEGGSAGGLLMGAVTNMRPDLFRAVVSHVPFVDVINTMLDPTLPLTVGEYEEWGNPQIKEHYDSMKTYCPYTNLEAKGYPSLLVKTSFNDSQVMYWEPAKYVARLRTLKADRNPLLSKTNMGAGHGGSSGRYDRLREVALDYAFILGQVGIAR